MIAYSIDMCTARPSGRGAIVKQGRIYIAMFSIAISLAVDSTVLLMGSVERAT